MENQMGQRMEHEMETGVWGLVSGLVLGEFEDWGSRGLG